MCCQYLARPEMVLMAPFDYFAAGAEISSRSHLGSCKRPSAFCMKIHLQTAALVIQAGVLAVSLALFHSIFPSIHKVICDYFSSSSHQESKSWFGSALCRLHYCFQRCAVLSFAFPAFSQITRRSTFATWHWMTLTLCSFEGIYSIWFEFYASSCRHHHSMSEQRFARF